MNDDRLLSELRTWLQAEHVALPDAERAGRELRARLPQARPPRRRWWSLRAVGGTRPVRSVRPATSNDGYQLTPIPAANGHPHIVTGRTQSMFSLGRIIVVGALTLAVGGAVMIARPYSQPGTSAPAPAASASQGTGLVESAAEPGTPVEFSATGSIETCETPATTGADGPVARTRGASCSQTFSSSDPRLQGTVSLVTNDDEYTDGSGLVIQSIAMSIENADGAWRMVPILSAKWPDPDTQAIEDDATVHVFLVGEGAYEGLIAVVDGFETDELHGFIIEGELPPSPENAYAGQS